VTFEHVPAVLSAPHGLLEGPCVLRDAIAFSDVLAGGVFRLNADDTVDELLPRRRGIGGIVAARDGGLLLTGKDVVLLDAAGDTRTIHADAAAAGFNDIGTCRDGSVIVGVLRYRPMAGETPQPGELIRITADGTADVVAGDFLWPNGIVELADGSLLASDFARGHVKHVAPSGESEVFFEVPNGAPDGLALDAEDHLWIASGHGGSLLRVGPDGALVEEVDVPARFVSSLCFAGPHLFVTTADNFETPDTGGTLLRAAAPVAGAEVPLAFAPLPNHD
jgi:sugar lactone lactonase YvrE